MRPQIGYSNLYWSNKDKKDMDKKNAALKEEDSVIESEDLIVIAKNTEKVAGDDEDLPVEEEEDSFGVESCTDSGLTEDNASIEEDVRIMVGFDNIEKPMGQNKITKITQSLVSEAYSRYV